MGRIPTLKKCPSCGSKKVRLEGSRYLCGNCNYENDFKIEPTMLEYKTYRKKEA